MADKEIITPYVIPISSTKPKLLSLVPSDPGSRYKTRQLQVQITGKSKMMKTILVNILEVAKDMQVPPSYVGTFMGYEIGAQAKWDPKKPERQQAFLSGEHATKDLSRICLQFIQEVVLCPRCGLPEIVVQVVDGKAMGRCRACGGFEEMRISNEKFKRYILNHPPTTVGDAFSKNKEVAKKPVAKKKGEEDEAPPKPEKKPGLPSAAADDDGVVWYSDLSEQAVKGRREQMLPESMVKVKKIPTAAELADIISSLDKLQEIKTANNLTDADFVPSLFEALIGTATDVSPAIKAKKTLKEFLGSQDAQIALLNTLEKFIGAQPALVAKASPIIKQFYDEELLEEDSILTWGKDSSSGNAKVREQAAPLLKWLKEAEEESSEEDE